MFVAQTSGVPTPGAADADADHGAGDDTDTAGVCAGTSAHLTAVGTAVTARPVSADEIWDFISHGITP